MAELKTTPNDKSVDKFLNNVKDDGIRKDCREILNIMSDITREKPTMWGSGIVGFGSYHYKYKSGREGDWFLTGFSPRKQNLTLYIMPGSNNHTTLMKQLGAKNTGSSCLYIKKFSDVNKPILMRLIKESVKFLKVTYR